MQTRSMLNKLAMNKPLPNDLQLPQIQLVDKAKIRINKKEKQSEVVIRTRSRKGSKLLELVEDTYCLGMMQKIDFKAVNRRHCDEESTAAVSTRNKSPASYCKPAFLRSVSKSSLDSDVKLENHRFRDYSLKRSYSGKRS